MMWSCPPPSWSQWYKKNQCEWKTRIFVVNLFSWFLVWEQRWCFSEKGLVIKEKVLQFIDSERNLEFCYFPLWWIQEQRRLFMHRRAAAAARFCLIDRFCTVFAWIVLFIYKVLKCFCFSSDFIFTVHIITFLYISWKSVIGFVLLLSWFLAKHSRC